MPKVKEQNLKIVNEEVKDETKRIEKKVDVKKKETKKQEQKKVEEVININDDEKIEELVEKAKTDAEVVELSNVIGEDQGEKKDIVEKPDYETEIVKIINSNSSPRMIKQKLADYHENNIANALSMLKPQERQKLFRILDDEDLAYVFEYVEEEEAGSYIREMDLKKAATLISNLEPDTAIEVLRELDKDKRTLLIDSMESDVRHDIKMIASFDEDEIGSEMTTNCIIIKDNLDIKGAMKELVRQAKENDNIQTIFVEDDKGEFYGAIDLKELIIARKEENLKSLIVTSFPYVYGHEDISDCVDKLREYNEALIPVLDNKNRMLGVITSQGLVDVVDDELSEDYVKFAGLTAEEDLKEPLFESMGKRLPWLIVLLFLGLIVSSVVGVYENVIKSLSIIIAFQSLILDMAGNSGTQSLAVTIRILTDENLTFRKKIAFVFKEVRVGFCNGILLGMMSFLCIGLYIIFIKHQQPMYSFAVSGCIGLSLIISMFISSAIGSLIPMICDKLNFDPAVASGPLITTINDLVAVITYYSLSSFLLLGVLHL